MKFLIIVFTVLILLPRFSEANYPFSRHIQRSAAHVTNIGATICYLLAAYKITAGSLELVTYSPLRGGRDIIWGAIGLCAAYTLHQWAKTWKSQLLHQPSSLKN